MDWTIVLKLGPLLFDGVAKLVAAFRSKPAAPLAPPGPTEAELLNQRQEQAAGAARNYSSRRTELAAHAKAATLPEKGSGK